MLKEPAISCISVNWTEDKEKRMCQKDWTVNKVMLDNKCKDSCKVLSVTGHMHYIHEEYIVLRCNIGGWCAYIFCTPSWWYESHAPWSRKQLRNSVRSSISRLCNWGYITCFYCIPSFFMLMLKLYYTIITTYLLLLFFFSDTSMPYNIVQNFKYAIFWTCYVWIFGIVLFSYCHSAMKIDSSLCKENDMSWHVNCWFTCL